METRDHLRELGVLDQPTLIEAQMREKGVSFKEQVAECVGHGRFTPAHAIMASMRIPAITTNYDQLYELAAESCEENPWGGNTSAHPRARGRCKGRAVASEHEVMALPYDVHKAIRNPDHRRLIKMHGCVCSPTSIVLTRSDYMRYEAERTALRGLLHTALMEKELLVLGFSMTDDNVHLIIDQVRKACGFKNDFDAEGNEGDCNLTMGTLITLVENKMFRRLWQDDFEVVSCGQSWQDEPAWIHDCFIDAVCAGRVQKTAWNSFLLDEEFESLLTEPQKKLKAALEPLRALTFDEEVTSSRAWQQVREMLDDFGERAHRRRGESRG